MSDIDNSGFEFSDPVRKESQRRSVFEDIAEVDKTIEKKLKEHETELALIAKDLARLFDQISNLSGRFFKDQSNRVDKLTEQVEHLKNRRDAIKVSVADLYKQAADKDGKIYFPHSADLESTFSKITDDILNLEDYVSNFHRMLSLYGYSETVERKSKKEVLESYDWTENKRLKQMAWVIGIVATLTGIIVAWPSIREMFKSERDKFIDEKFVHGSLHPDPLTRTQPSISLDTGSQSHYFNDQFPKVSIMPDSIGPPIRGIYVGDLASQDVVYICLGNDTVLIHADQIVDKAFNPLGDLRFIWACFTNDTGSTPAGKLQIGVHRDRLFVSSIFVDIQRRETIGNIEYNHWRLFKDKIFDWREDDYRFEAHDRDDNIIFSVKFQNPNVIHIRGYFISQSVLTIVNEHGVLPCNHISPNDNQFDHTSEIEDIKSIF